MAINVSYSPVAAAVGLAAQAGNGQRVVQQRQYDLQFQDLVNQMQAHADQVNSNQISQAMEEQRIGLGASEAQDRQHQQVLQQQALESYRQANLGATMQNRDATNQINQQRADAQTTAAGAQRDNATLGQAKFADKQDAISELPEDQQTMVRAQGHLQSTGASNGADPRHFALQQYKAYERDLQQAMKDQQAASYDPNDKRKFLAEQSGDNPAAIKGMEAAYAAAAKRIADAQKKLTDISTELQPNNIPVVSPQAVQQIAQQNQQGQGPAQQLQGQQGQPAVVNSQEDYAQLPSGSLYVDSQDGQVYRKK